MTGSRIRQLRTQRGWTQSQLAEAVGVSRVHISRLENDQFVVKCKSCKTSHTVDSVSHNWTCKNCGLNQETSPRRKHNIEKLLILIAHALQTDFLDLTESPPPKVEYLTPVEERRQRLPAWAQEWVSDLENQILKLQERLRELTAKPSSEPGAVSWGNGREEHAMGQKDYVRFWFESGYLEARHVGNGVQIHAHPARVLVRPSAANMVSLEPE